MSRTSALLSACEQECNTGQTCLLDRQTRVVKTNSQDDIPGLIMKALRPLIIQPLSLKASSHPPNALPHLLPMPHHLLRPRLGSSASAEFLVHGGGGGAYVAAAHACPRRFISVRLVSSPRDSAGQRSWPAWRRPGPWSSSITHASHSGRRFDPLCGRDCPI